MHGTATPGCENAGRDVKKMGYCVSVSVIEYSMLTSFALMAYAQTSRINGSEHGIDQILPCQVEAGVPCPQPINSFTIMIHKIQHTVLTMTQ